MDPYNIDDKSSNFDNVEARPLKKAKCKQMDDCDLSLASISSPTTSLSSSLVTYSDNIHPSDAEMNGTRSSESDKEMNDESIVSDDNKKDQLDLDQQTNGEIVLLNYDKQLENHEKFEVDQTYDYLPQDYSMTELDYRAHITIETSLSNEILVKIDEIFVTQAQLLCLLEPDLFLNDDVISAYICCIKDQAHSDVKFYFENPFISVMLKGDGQLGIKKDGNCVTEIVKNYLKHEMVLLPINIEDTHWY